MKAHRRAFKTPFNGLLLSFATIVLIFSTIPVNVSGSDKDWTVGVEKGDYVVNTVISNTITGTPAGTKIIFQIAKITKDDVYYIESRSFPDSSQTTELDATHDQVREGYFIFSTSSKSHAMTTINTEYLQDFLKNNDSGNVKFSLNDTHFFIHDYFFMAAHNGAPDHYHDFNATYNRATGWLEYIEVSHVHLDLTLRGIIKIQAIEFGNAEVTSLYSPFSIPDDPSSDSGFIVVDTLLYSFIPIMIIWRYKNPRRTN